MCVCAVCPYWWHVSYHQLFFKILKLFLQLRVFCFQFLNLHKNKSRSVTLEATVNSRLNELQWIRSATTEFTIINIHYWYFSSAQLNRINRNRLCIN